MLGRTMRRELARALAPMCAPLQTADVLRAGGRIRRAYVDGGDWNDGEREAQVRATQILLNALSLRAFIDDPVANMSVAQLFYLAQDNPDRDIQMDVNNRGAQFDVGLAINDTNAPGQPQVATTCISMGASVGLSCLQGPPKANTRPSQVRAFLSTKRRPPFREPLRISKSRLARSSG